VYYQDILKPNQEAVWARVANDTPLRYPELRRFLLFGFGDAAGLENRKEDTGSAYELAQTAIAAELLAAHAAQPNVPVVFLAQSLGCQVLSSYLYDAQKAAAGLPVVAGIWKDVDAWSLRTLGRRLGADERAFLAGGTCSALLTTGCVSIVGQRGYLADEILLESVQPGVDNRQSVERTLGRPSFVGQFGEPVWYYVSSSTTQAPNASRIGPQRPPGMPHLAHRSIWSFSMPSKAPGASGALAASTAIRRSPPSPSTSQPRSLAVPACAVVRSPSSAPA